MDAILRKSTRKDKRYMVQLQADQGTRTIHFGSPSHDNFTMHKDPARRNRYLARHAKNEDWNDYTTAGFWSRWVLWEEPYMLDAIKRLKGKGINLSIR